MEKFAMFLVALLVIAGVAGYIWWSQELVPKQNEYNQIKQKIDEIEQQISETENIKRQFEELQQRLEKLTVEHKKLSVESISLQEVVPRLLDSTELISNKFNVTFQDIRVSQIIRAEEWHELPVELTILGTFKNIGNFLYVVEKRKLLNIAAGSMNISVSAEVDKESKHPLLSVVLSAKVFIPYN